MTTARVPLIDETTGRFPDAYAPPSVAAAVTTVTEKASVASTSATTATMKASEASASATAAANSATTASAAATTASDAADAAETARDETIVAVTALGNVSGTLALSQAQSRSTFLTATLTGNLTITLADGVPGQAYSCTLRLDQDSTGSRLLTITGALTAYGVAIVLSTAANARDVIRLEWDGEEWSAYMGGASMAVPTGWAAA